MTALGHEHFLVDERTDQVAKLFEISLEGATNILGSPWDDEATSPSLEQTDDLAAAGVTPVSKTERLVASSLEGAATRYPGKIEGASLTADGKLILINDNDFGIAGAPTQILVVEGTRSARARHWMALTPFALSKAEFFRRRGGAIPPRCRIPNS